MRAEAPSSFDCFQPIGNVIGVLKSASKSKGKKGGEGKVRGPHAGAALPVPAPRLKGFYNETVYSHNPVDYVAGEREWWRVEQLRRLDIILTAGQTDPLRYATDDLSRALWAKEIWHAVRVWDGFGHDWPHWYKMVPKYIGGPD